MGRRSTQELGMVEIKEILRLRSQGLSGNRIAQSLNTARSTVQDYLRLCGVAGLTHEQALEKGEDELRKLLGKGLGRQSSEVVVPDWEYVQKELSRRGMTLALLWEEYRSKNQKGHCYSNFCILYRKWLGTKKVSFRQTYKAGEKAFVDYAGLTLSYRTSAGEAREAQIFVMALGASNLTYAEAQDGQDLKSWLGGHERAFNYFGGVPELLVPDNLKAGVKRACYYEPEVNRTYLEFAEHYDLAILPTRVRKPQDKAKVEEAVQNVERRILAKLRDGSFHSLEEINAAIWKELEELNSRPMQIYGCSRWEFFKQVEQAALKPLPKTSFELGCWKVAKVNIDYHIEIARHYYSVPYQLIGQNVEVRFSEKTVVVFHNGKSVAQHLRSNEPYRHTTLKEHLPADHQFMLSLSPSRFIDWAGKIGEQAKLQVQAILSSRKHPEQAYRSCLGLIRLADKFGKERLEAACKKANSFGVTSYKTVKNILVNNRDKLEQHAPKHNPIPHGNLRGEDYYH